jgi:hypothetical protein
MRTTLYADASQERRAAAFDAIPLVEVHGASAGKQQRSKRLAPSVEANVVSEVLTANWAQYSRDSSVYESVVLMAACN